MTADSYTATRLGFSGRLKEAISLYRHHGADIKAQVTDHLKWMDGTRATIEAVLGRPLVHQDILEIGPGQQLRQARYFAADNRVVAIDLDEILISLTPLALLRTLRVNGPVRAAKTLLRKLAGFDRRFIKELISQRPTISGSCPRVLRRDATSTELPSGSFDCAMSFSVFEHLPDPSAVFREISRLLRPGGISHHIIHLYASDTGAHDARSYLENRSGFPYWCHLRPDVKHLLASNCYVNKVTLAQWQSILTENCPGAQVSPVCSGTRYVDALRELRAAGMLSEYTDEELLTVCLEVTWKKPCDRDF
jgi:SAM-dependent methyltransferase